MRSRTLLSEFVSTEGIIVDRITCSSGSGDRTYAAVIEYFDEFNQETYQFRTSSCTNPGPTVGNSITVLYDPENPGEAVNGSFLGLWLLPLVLFGLGSICLCVLTFGICRVCCRGGGGEAPQTNFGETPGPKPTETAPPVYNNGGANNGNTYTTQNSNPSPGYGSSNSNQYEYTVSQQPTSSPGNKPQNGGNTSLFDQLDSKI